MTCSMRRTERSATRKKAPPSHAGLSAAWAPDCQPHPQSRISQLQRSLGNQQLLRIAPPALEVPATAPVLPNAQQGSAGAPGTATALPTATFAEFATSGQVRCCRLHGPAGCPPHLGVAKPGDSHAKNGMNLSFSISGHRPSVEYGFVQVVHSKQCVHDDPANGGWWKAGEQGPGLADSPDPGATCTRPNRLSHITMADAPGETTMLGSREGVDPTLTEVTRRTNATDWVIAREGSGPWTRVSEFFHWHSTTWIRRDAAGRWVLAPRGNSIGKGFTAIGSCPPPS